MPHQPSVVVLDPVRASIRCSDSIKLVIAVKIIPLRYATEAVSTALLTSELAVSISPCIFLLGPASLGCDHIEV